MRYGRRTTTQSGQQGDDGGDAGAGLALRGQAGFGGGAGQRGVVAPIIDLVQATQQLLDQAMAGQWGWVHRSAGETVRQ